MLDSIQILLAEFSVIYIFVHIVCVLYSKKCISEWVNFENMIDQRVKIYRKFERLFIKDSGGRFQQQDEFSGGGSGTGLPESERKEYEDLKKSIKYIVLRQEFLSPTFLPLMREAVLRDDFRFSDYLAKCIYKTIQEVLQLRTSTIMSFLVFLLAYSIIRFIVSEKYEMLAMFFISVSFFFLHLAFKIQTQRIFSQLSHPLKSPYEFQVSPFDAIRNPRGNQDKIFTPKYLRDNFSKIEISKSRIINAHQALFWFSSPIFCLRLLHFTLIFQITWIVVYFSNYYEVIFKSWPSLIISIVSSFCIMFNLTATFPVTVRNFAIITNVGFFTLKIP